jgi:hypothetical protein
MKTDFQYNNLPYKELDIPELDKVISELQNYTQNLHPGLYKAVNSDESIDKLSIDQYVKELQHKKHGFWRGCYPDVHQDLLDECPTLQKSLQEYGKVVNVAFFCLWQKDSVIHSDDIVMDLKSQSFRMDPKHEMYYEDFPPWPIRSRINIPIFNCEKSKTIWWKPHKEKESQQNVFRTYLPEECDKIAELTLNKATLLRVDIPHQVINDGWRMPRLAATITTDQDLTDYL